jgi:hypothetical protein
MSDSDYLRGLKQANRGLRSLSLIFGEAKIRKVAERKHDQADSKMYIAMALGKSVAADFNRGLATGYGMYARTGKTLER